MNDAGVGRLLVASLHQGIQEVRALLLEKHTAGCFDALPVDFGGFCICPTGAVPIESAEKANANGG